MSGPPSPSPAKTGPKAAGINDAFGWHVDAGVCPQNEMEDGESVALSRTCRPTKLQPARRGTGESRTRALVMPMPRTEALSIYILLRVGSSISQLPPRHLNTWQEN